MQKTPGDTISGCFILEALLDPGLSVTMGHMDIERNVDKRVGRQGGERVRKAHKITTAMIIMRYNREQARQIDLEQISQGSLPVAYALCR